MAEKLEHLVPEGVADARLDKYLADAVGVSRARIKEAFDAGTVRVDGRRAKKGDKVVAGSKLTVELPTHAQQPPAPDPALPLAVVKEDPDFVVLDKPAGMATHPLEGEELGTLANALVARYPECAGLGDDVREGGVVHRLDVETSGLVIAARNADSYRALREAFGQKTVKKTYLALVSGAVGPEGTIAVPIAHLDKRRMVATPTDEDAAHLKARPAQTDFKTLERHGGFALLEVDIPTGVMHQIRVHLAAIGCPVVGDSLYGGEPLEGLSRQFLHAAAVTFPHPKTGAPVHAEAPLPKELADVLERLRRA